MEQGAGKEPGTPRAFDQLAPRDAVERAETALEQHGINVIFVRNGKAARSKVLSIIPEGSSVMNMTSMTLSAIGLDKEINESGLFDSIRNKLNNMDRSFQNDEMQMLGAGPPWAIGSVHAVTETGSVMLASRTGSQLSAYANGATHVVWVAGTQKIVRDQEEGFRRINEYCLPHEDARARKAYGTESEVNKVLIVFKEHQAGRITLVLVNECLGF